MRYRETVETVTFKCEGCGDRFPREAMYTGPSLARATSTFVCVCSLACFVTAQQYSRSTKRFSY
jgi:hypothetical protein